jgi:F420-dependent oxidoreductase-like protein
MRFGAMIYTASSVDGAIEQARAMHEHGFDSCWVPQIYGYDALTLLAVVGREVPELELGTAVVPALIYHPLTLAIQALTTQAATSGRLTLGIGLSHQVQVEGVCGRPWDHPVTDMEEFLGVLQGLLDGQVVRHQGGRYTTRTFAPLDVKAPAPAVLLAALGPRMLRIAGSRCAGTVTWMTGPRTIATHIVPGISKAAEEAGRARPRVVCALPIVVTDDPDSAKDRIAEIFAIYGHLPSYRAMLDREGVAGPADVAVVGDEEAVARELARLRDGGATDFVAVLVGGVDERVRTLALLQELRGEEH